ncbi:hypothetical protein [Akkermansia sp.]|uniref:hypothetical protein n=1 Tax=Akkermansia sp. TaxID=1872421 RepID=UPI0025BF72CF|nr:hypothetical protein [Akkermansia sp.]MCC8147500.1 hypothetical protein [Akkermansia sp.]
MNGEIEIGEPRMMADGGVELSACLRTGGKHWKQYLRVRGDSLHPEGLDNSGDVWTVLFLHKMMEYGGHYKVRGTVSASLLPGLDRYVRAWVNLQPARYNAVTLEPDTVEDDRGRVLRPECLACFSGGLDACFTAFRHARVMAGPQNQQLNACLMVRGADIRKDYEADWKEASRMARELTDDLGIPRFYTVETNFRDMHCAYGMSYFSMLVACMRIFDRDYGHLMLGSDNCFSYFHLASGNNPVTNHFLSSHGVEVITDGAEYTRTEKAAVVAQWPLALQKLRVCYQGKDLSCNCGTCGKCRRTRLNFLAVGVKELPCMPPLQNEDELLDFMMTPVEQLEISLLLEYLDAHPLRPVPVWESRLRAMMGSPAVAMPEKKCWFSRFAYWCRKTIACVGGKKRCNRRGKRGHRSSREPSSFIRVSREGESSFSSEERH